MLVVYNEQGIAEKVMKRVPELIAELPEIQELMQMLLGEIMVKLSLVILIINS